MTHHVLNVLNDHNNDIHKSRRLAVSLTEMPTSFVLGLYIYVDLTCKHWGDSRAPVMLSVGPGHSLWQGDPLSASNVQHTDLQPEMHPWL